MTDLARRFTIFAVLSWIILMALGCAYSSVRKDDFKATSIRWLWDTEVFEGSYDPTNGTYQVKLGNTGQNMDGAIKLLNAVK